MPDRAGLILSQILHCTKQNSGQTPWGMGSFGFYWYIIVADYRTGQAVEKRQVFMIHSLTSYLIGNLKEINAWARIRRHPAIELFEKRRTLSWPVLMRAI